MTVWKEKKKSSDTKECQAQAFSFNFFIAFPFLILFSTKCFHTWSVPRSIAADRQAEGISLQSNLWESRAIVSSRWVFSFNAWIKYLKQIIMCSCENCDPETWLQSPPPPPSKGQWQYTKDLPFSNVNISWNKDDFLYKLCISQGRRLDSASRVQSSREVRMETRCSLGDWSLISGNGFFPWLLVSLTSLTISRQLVLIPKGLSSVLFSNKQTFNLTMTLSTSIFRAVKAT